MKIEALLNRHLLDKQKARSKRIRSGKWSPSSFGRCYRYQYWNRKNKPQTNKPDVEVLRIFAIGSLIHDFIQGVIPDKQCEVKVETEDIIGFADIVLENEVIDIKSIRSYAYRLLGKKGYDIEKDKYDNILQVMTYCKLLNKPTGTLLFVEKDGLKMKSFSFELKDWDNRIVSELSVLRTIWLNDELPKGQPRAYNGKECRYCAYLDACKERGDVNEYVANK